MDGTHPPTCATDRFRVAVRKESGPGKALASWEIRLLYGRAVSITRMWTCPWRVAAAGSRATRRMGWIQSLRKTTPVKRRSRLGRLVTAQGDGSGGWSPGGRGGTPGSRPDPW